MDQNPYESPKTASTHQGFNSGTPVSLGTQSITAILLIVAGLILHATAIAQGQLWAAGISAGLSISSGIWLATLIRRFMRN